jgi:hypothetical protein
MIFETLATSPKVLPSKSETSCPNTPHGNFKSDAGTCVKIKNYVDYSVTSRAPGEESRLSMRCVVPALGYGVPEVTVKDKE